MRTDFKYTPSDKTDIRKTFANARKQEVKPHLIKPAELAVKAMKEEILRFYKIEDALVDAMPMLEQLEEVTRDMNIIRSVIICHFDLYGSMYQDYPALIFIKHWLTKDAKSHFEEDFPDDNMKILTVYFDVLIVSMTIHFHEGEQNGKQD